MSSDSENLLPPDNPVDFESLCLDLWKEIWQDPNAQKNGRSGQPQAGVDVFGRCRGQWIGVQCKQKNQLFWRQVTIPELETEVQEARLFSPALSSFILATTGPVDARLQKRARELTVQHQHEDLFEVSVWSWREIWRELHQRLSLLRRVGPVYWPRLWHAGIAVAASVCYNVIIRFPQKFAKDKLLDFIAALSNCTPVRYKSWVQYDENSFQIAFHFSHEVEPSVFEDVARQCEGRITHLSDV